MSAAIEDRDRLEQLAIKIAYNNGYEAAKRREVQTAMEKRCEEQNHDYENCCSVMFRIYQRCKWCGEER